MKQNFVDIHHHLAYGVDDGPKSLRQMQKMLSHANEEGIGTIIATPHATPGVQRFPMEEYRQALTDARAYCAEMGLEIEILEGCEVLFTDQTPRLLCEGQIPTLAGTDFVLVEFSPDVKYARMREALERLLCEGFRPVVAHVERCDCLSHHPTRAAKLREELEVLYQVNCSSIIRNKGWRVRHFLKKMLENELIDVVATDAHNVNSRPANMKEAYKILKKKYGGKYARKLTNGSFLTEE